MHLGKFRKKKKIHGHIMIEKTRLKVIYCIEGLIKSGLDSINDE